MGYKRRSFNKTLSRSGLCAGVSRWIHGLWSWLLFGLIALTLIGLCSGLPARQQRRAAARHAARAFLLLTATRPVTSGIQYLSEGSCIIVANHASYLDGLILTAVLPPRFSFVIKREMTRVPLAHFLLRCLGSQFVERFDTRRGAADARRVLSLAASQESLAFFPEGTFKREPGLRRFQNGAFAAALRGNLPVIPVAIVGSRQILAAGQWLPRRGTLSVIVKPAVHHNGEPDGMQTLLQQCRQAILDEIDEPDIAAMPAHHEKQPDTSLSGDPHMPV